MSEDIRVDKRKKSILHVTDAFAGGILTTLISLSESQAAQDRKVGIAFLTRRETILPLSDNKSKVEFKNYGNYSWIGIIRLSRNVLKLRKEYDYIHLHSSRMGFIGRMMSNFFSQNTLFYSPHGYSFLRQDISKIKQRVFFLLEKIAAKKSNVTILCYGQLELSLSINLFQVKALPMTHEVQVPLEFINLEKINDSRRLRICFCARNTPAKDPSYFLRVAEKFKDTFDFVWIGGYKHDFPENVNVEFKGFVSHPDALRIMSSCDILFVSSLWEALPLNIVEAQMLGLLVIARNSNYLDGLVSHGKTGLVFNSFDELESMLNVDLLVNNYRTIPRFAWEEVSKNYSKEELIIRWERGYGERT